MFRKLQLYNTMVSPASNVHCWFSGSLAIYSPVELTPLNPPALSPPFNEAQFNSLIEFVACFNTQACFVKSLLRCTYHVFLLLYVNWICWKTTLRNLICFRLLKSIEKKTVFNQSRVKIKTQLNETNLKIHLE